MSLAGKGRWRARLSSPPSSPPGATAEGRRWSRLEQSRVFVVEAFQLHARNFLADEPLDRGDLLDVLGNHDGKCVPHALRAAGAADAVNVVLGMMRHVEVDDVADLLDVDSARGDVGGDHHFVAAAAETVQCLLALVLGAVGVKHRDGMAFLMELARDAVGAVLGAAEDEHLVVVGSPEKLLQEFLLLVAGHGIQRMRHCLGGRAAQADLDGLGIAQRPVAELLDFRRDGGGKQHRLSRGRTTFDNAAHVGQEPHIEHPIRFVQDENLDPVEPNHAALHLIEQAPRRRHDDVHAPTQRLVLSAIACSAEDDRGAQVGEARIIANGGLDLSREFAGGFEHERPQRAVLGEAGENRHRECGGLAGACLGGADEVPARHQDRDSAELDRSGVSVTRGANTFEHFGGKTEFGEWHNVFLGVKKEVRPADFYLPFYFVP